MQRILEKIAATDTTPEVLCVIDAMDESDDDAALDMQRHDIMSLFSRIVGDFRNSRFKIIILSRPFRTIEREFKYCHQIALDKVN